jgi:hypothetical protein
MPWPARLLAMRNGHDVSSTHRSNCSFQELGNLDLSRFADRSLMQTCALRIGKRGLIVTGDEIWWTESPYLVSSAVLPHMSSIRHAPVKNVAPRMYTRLI